MSGKRECESIISIGKVRIGLVCPSPEYARGLNTYFQNHEDSHQADMWLDLTITTENRDIDLCDSLFLTKQAKGFDFIMGNGLVKGSYNPELKKGRLQVHYALTSDTRTRVFEQVMYQAFYTASRQIGSRCFLVHSCGIIKDKRGYLFVGKSGSGKSTIAKISKQHIVLNDEICLVDIDAKDVILHSTPFNGLFTEKQPGSAILDSIFILNQSKAHSITPLSAGKAIQVMVSEIVPPMGLLDNMNDQLKKMMFSTAYVLATRCPVYTLHFLPDSGFWQVIGKRHG